MTQASGPSSCISYAGDELVCGQSFPLFDPNGQPSLQFRVAALNAVLTLAKGCLGGAVAEEFNITPEAARDMLDDMIMGVHS